MAWHAWATALCQNIRRQIVCLLCDELLACLQLLCACGGRWLVPGSWPCNTAVHCLSTESTRPFRKMQLASIFIWAFGFTAVSSDSIFCLMKVPEAAFQGGHVCRSQPVIQQIMHHIVVLSYRFFPLQDGQVGGGLRPPEDSRQDQGPFVLRAMPSFHPSSFLLYKS